MLYLSEYIQERGHPFVLFPIFYIIIFMKMWIIIVRKELAMKKKLNNQFISHFKCNSDYTIKL